MALWVVQGGFERCLRIDLYDPDFKSKVSRCQALQGLTGFVSIESKVLSRN